MTARRVVKESQELIQQALESDWPDTPMKGYLAQLATRPGILDPAVRLVQGVARACGQALRCLPGKEAAADQLERAAAAVADALGWLLVRQTVQRAELEAWEYVRSPHLMAAAMGRAAKRAALKQQEFIVVRFTWLLAGLLARGAAPLEVAVAG
jgi:hypothetical protein